MKRVDELVLNLEHTFAGKREDNENKFAVALYESVLEVGRVFDREVLISALAKHQATLKLSQYLSIHEDTVEALKVYGASAQLFEKFSLEMLESLVELQAYNKDIDLQEDSAFRSIWITTMHSLAIIKNYHARQSAGSGRLRLGILTMCLSLASLAAYTYVLINGNLGLWVNASALGAVLLLLLLGIYFSARLVFVREG